MPYSLAPGLDAPTSAAPAPVPSSVCTLTTCDDPAVVVLARADDLDDLGDTLPQVLTARLCATHARDAVDDLLRRACLGLDAPSLALTPITEEARA